MPAPSTPGQHAAAAVRIDDDHPSQHHGGAEHNSDCFAKLRRACRAMHALMVTARVGTHPNESKGISETSLRPAVQRCRHAGPRAQAAANAL